MLRSRLGAKSLRDSNFENIDKHDRSAVQIREVNIKARRCKKTKINANNETPQLHNLIVSASAIV